MSWSRISFVLARHLSKVAVLTLAPPCVVSCACRCACAGRPFLFPACLLAVVCDDGAALVWSTYGCLRASFTPVTELEPPGLQYTGPASSVEFQSHLPVATEYRKNAPGCGLFSLRSDVLLGSVAWCALHLAVWHSCTVRAARAACSLFGPCSCRGQATERCHSLLSACHSKPVLQQRVQTWRRSQTVRAMVPSAEPDRVYNIKYYGALFAGQPGVPVWAHGLGYCVPADRTCTARALIGACAHGNSLCLQ